MKLLVNILMILTLLINPVFAAVNTDGELIPADVQRVWPKKASWVGESAVFFWPKMVEKATYLFVFENPLENVSGYDQMLLAQKLSGETFVVKGLFVKKGKSEYYWLLESKDKKRKIWVRDHGYQLADLPFSMAAEIEADLRVKEDLKVFVGQTVWYNKNVDVFKKNKVNHLEPLIITEIESGGAFSPRYKVKATTADGNNLEWVTGFAGQPPAYHHASFQKALGSCFYLEDLALKYPKWTEADWDAVKERVIKKGWEKDKVLISWGAPQKIETDPGNQKDARWVYPDKTILFFKEKVLAKIMVPAKVVEQVAENAKQTGKPTKDKYAGYAEVDQKGK